MSWFVLERLRDASLGLFRGVVRLSTPGGQESNISSIFPHFPRFSLIFLNFSPFSSSIWGSWWAGLKSLHILFDKYLDLMPVNFFFKCRPMVQTTRNFEIFDIKPGFLQLFLTKR